MSRSTRRIPDVSQLSAESAQFMRVLNDEPDLAVAIVGPSYLEMSLGVLLARSFIKSSVVHRALDPRSFLGTFSARADLAYLLGLIPKAMYQDLDVIAQVRNRFAHSHVSVTFTRPEIIALCAKLRFFDYFATSLGVEELDAIKWIQQFSAYSARNMFVVTIALIAGRLDARSRVLQNPPYDSQP